MNASLEDFIDELIPFLTILAQQCFDVFNRGSLERLKPVAFVDLLYNGNNVFASSDVGGKKITHAARWLSFGPQCLLLSALCSHSNIV